MRLDLVISNFKKPIFQLHPPCCTMAMRVYSADVMFITMIWAWPTTCVIITTAGQTETFSLIINSGISWARCSFQSLFLALAWASPSGAFTRTMIWTTTSILFGCHTGWFCNESMMTCMVKELYWSRGRSGRYIVMFINTCVRCFLRGIDGLYKTSLPEKNWHYMKKSEWYHA